MKRTQHHNCLILRKAFDASTPAAQHQRGFALVVVLMVLLVLAALVAGVLQNQTLALRETGDLFAASERQQMSHNVHRACLNKVRADLSSNTLGSPMEVSWVTNSGNGVAVNVAGKRYDCIIRPVFSSSMSSSMVDWQPILRISSTAEGYTESSEWRYEPCAQPSDMTTCAHARANIKMIDDSGTVQVVRPSFQVDQVVKTAWRRD